MQNNQIELLQNDYLKFIDDRLDIAKDSVIKIVESDYCNSKIFEIRYNKNLDIGYTNPIPSEQTAYLLYSTERCARFHVR